jgi:hypothetical protein
MLTKAGLSVWIDENELKLGDRLRAKIDHGLAKSRYGIVILSEDFFSKDWPQWELSSLVARELNNQKVVLPVWHGVDREFVTRYSPLLADRFAISTNIGLEQVALKIVQVIKNEPHSSLELISYDLLDNTLIALGVAKWTPRTLRLGLEWGTVSEESGHIKFCDHFIETMCEVSRDWVTTRLGRFLTKSWFYEQVLVAVIRATPQGALTGRIDDLAYFVPNILPHLVSYVFEVGRTVQVIESYTGRKFELHREFTRELREIIKFHANEISSLKKVRPLMFKTFLDLTKTRLILYDKKHVNHTHLLAVIVGFIFYKNIIKKMEHVFKTGQKQVRAKRMPYDKSLTAPKSRNREEI